MLSSSAMDLPPLRPRIIPIRDSSSANNAKSDLVALEIFHFTFPRQTICRTLRRVSPSSRNSSQVEEFLT